MKNTKVVVMGPQDVAAMRRATKDAAAAYFEAKVGALEFIAEEMKQSGEEFTAAELSAMSGLSSAEIAQQFGCSVRCKAATRAGLGWGDIQTNVRFIETKYVRVMPSGEINPDQSITVTRRQQTYKMRPNHRQ